MASKRAIDIVKRFLLSFRRNWGLKLISLFFAAVLWNYVIVEINPTSTQTFPVAVTPQGLTQLKNNNLTVKGDLAKWLPKTVNVSVELRRSEAATFSSNRIQVYADFQYVTHEGEAVEIVLTHNQNAAGTTISPPKIKVPIERRDKRLVPVSYEYTGGLPDGYWMSEPEYTKTLEISGAISEIGKVTGARVTIDLTDLKQDMSAALDYTLYAGDQPIEDTAGLEYSTNGIFNIKVYPKKTVAVDAEGSLIGEVARGYRLGAVTCSPSSIEVYGPESLLKNLDRVKTTAINVDGATGTQGFISQVKLPNGVYAVNNADTVEVDVAIVEKTMEVTLDRLPVSITGLGTGLKVDAKFYATVTITCPELGSSSIRPSKVRLFVDAAGLEAGSHTLPVRVEYAEGVKVYDIKINPQNIAVQIKPATP